MSDDLRLSYGLPVGDGDEAEEDEEDEGTIVALHSNRSQAEGNYQGSALAIDNAREQYGQGDGS